MIFIFVLFLFAIIFIGCWLIAYIAHVWETIDTEKEYDFTTFNTFLKEFSKYKDNPNLYYGDGKYNNDIFILENSWSYSYLIRLSDIIIRFNDKYMILYPIDWLRYFIWKHKKTYKNRNKRVKGLWDNKE